MPLRHLLYRCPLCGRDPVRGTRERVACDGCGARFSRGPGALIRVASADREDRLVHPARLHERIQRAGGPMTAATTSDGAVTYGARALMARATGEEAVLHGGALLGFCETLGPETAGTARVDPVALSFHPGEGRPERWELLALSGMQVSSGTLQILPRGEPLAQLRFAGDSPLRWDVLLRTLIREAYRAAGRGEVVEFQPRIVVT